MLESLDRQGEALECIAPAIDLNTEALDRQARSSALQEQVKAYCQMTTFTVEEHNLNRLLQAGAEFGVGDQRIGVGWGERDV